MHGNTNEYEADYGEDLEAEDNATNGSRGRFRSGHRGIGNDIFYSDWSDRGRWDNRLDKNLGNIKMKIPSFQGKNDLDVYLEWQK